MSRRISFIRFIQQAALALILCQLEAGAQRRPPRDLSDRGNIPTWEYNQYFTSDLFRFTRVEFNGGRGWRTDFPNADLNFSWRLNQITSLEVHPEPQHLSLLDPELRNNPLILMIDPRRIILSDPEVDALRSYLLNGGFLMVDDFWGDRMWNAFHAQMKRVLPDIEPVSLPHDHEIFNNVFSLQGPPQVPSEDSAERNKDAADPYRTWEDEISWEPPQPADFRAYFDDDHRMIALICLNTDLSDGWEEEGVSKWYFDNYSEQFSYPMGINIVFYVMTH